MDQAGYSVGLTEKLLISESEEMEVPPPLRLVFPSMPFQEVREQGLRMLDGSPVLLVCREVLSERVLELRYFVLGFSGVRHGGWCWARRLNAEHLGEFTTKSLEPVAKGKRRP